MDRVNDIRVGSDRSTMLDILNCVGALATHRGSNCGNILSQAK